MPLATALRRAVAGLALASFGVSPRIASAQSAPDREDVPQGGAAHGAADEPDDEPGPPAPSPPAAWAIGVSPLALIVGRYGGDALRMVAPGEAIVLSLHFDYASRDFGPLDWASSAPVWGFGGEIGWRTFPASRRMQGVFLQASVLGEWDSLDYYGRRFGLYGGGLAGDLGLQAELGDHAFLSAGVGLQHLWTRRYPADVAHGVSWVMGAGFDPRVLLTIGARFR
jgi:hypothetical protein